MNNEGRIHGKYASHQRSHVDDKAHERIRVYEKDEKEKANQACENHDQIFVATLSVNDHTMYDWIVDSGATQHMTFEQEWFTTYERISPRRVFMGDDTIWEAIGKGNIKATM